MYDTASLITFHRAKSITRKNLIPSHPYPIPWRVLTTSAGRHHVASEVSAQVLIQFKFRHRQVPKQYTISHSSDSKRKGECFRDRSNVFPQPNAGAQLHLHQIKLLETIDPLPPSQQRSV